MADIRTEKTRRLQGRASSNDYVIHRSRSTLLTWRMMKHMKWNKLDRRKLHVYSAGLQGARAFHVITEIIGSTKAAVGAKSVGRCKLRRGGTV